MSKHKHYDVIVAWAEGKPIQFKNPNSTTWEDHNSILTPGFRPDKEYRVKPEPSTIWLIEWPCQYTSVQIKCTVYTEAQRDSTIRNLMNAGIKNYKVTLFKEATSDA